MHWNYIVEPYQRLARSARRRAQVCYLGMDPALQCVTLWRQREYLEKFEGRQARGPSPAVAA